MYSTYLSEQDKQLGFEETEIKNPEKYFMEPEKIKAIVKNISLVERIVKTNHPDGIEMYSHQWKWNEDWKPCCNYEASTGLNPFELYCSQYGEFSKIIDKHHDDLEGIHGLIIRSHGENKLEVAKRNIQKRNLPHDISGLE